MFTFDRGELARPRFIINFPTKKHWRSPSKLEYIDAGLDDLVNEVKRLGITSIALPALGCSNGGLAWSDVQPRIERAFEALPDVRAMLFEPRQAEDSVPLSKPGKRPNLTLGRALMIKLIDFYREPGYSLGRLEAQKLAYFLQEAGQDLKLTFVKHKYGPYAEAVNHVLQAIDGHYITGYGDRSGSSKLRVVPGVATEAERYLEPHRDARERLERVRELIEGFETPYGMELLASLHWLIAHEGAKSYEDALARFRNWNERKTQLFQDEHVDIAWQHLSRFGWTEQAAASKASGA
jgi:O-acetyl-ADP-ribose deacetylase (regulator of RNase III)